MSDLPLSTPTPRAIALAAPSLSAAQDELRSYNQAPSVVVNIILDAVDAYGVALNTPWCLVGEPNARVIRIMTARLGPPLTVPDALNVWNNEFSVDPRKLQP